jgi:hypothetical protein
VARHVEPTVNDDLKSMSRTDAGGGLAERSTNKFNPVIWNKSGSAPSASWLPENEEMPLNPNRETTSPMRLDGPDVSPRARGRREMSSPIVAHGP